MCATACNLMQQFEECTALVDKVLAAANGRCEYALHVKALIARQKGWIGLAEH